MAGDNRDQRRYPTVHLKTGCGDGAVGMHISAACICTVSFFFISPIKRKRRYAGCFSFPDLSGVPSAGEASFSESNTNIDFSFNGNLGSGTFS